MQGVIITGANGFLGSALAVCLAEQDIDVYAVVKVKTVLRSCLRHPKIHIVYCDLKDITTLDQRMPMCKVDVFYHLAWAGTSGDSRADYELQLDNVKYCCHAVSVAAKLGCSKFVFAGSIMEYEAISYIPQSEESPGLSYIYSTAKLTAHFMAKVWAGKFGIDFIEMIISNIYGVGEHSRRLINTTVQSYLENRQVAFSAGEQLYDFIYITDAVKSFQLIGERGIGGNQYYIGNEIPRPLKVFITELYEYIKPSFPLILGEIPFKGPMLTYREFDTMSLSTQFGFQPEVPFQEGIGLLVDWIKSLKEG